MISSFVTAVLAMFVVGSVFGQPVSVTPETARDGLAYPISDFAFEYALPHPDLPPLDVLEDTRVELVRTEQGLIGPVAGTGTQVVRLGDFDGSVTEMVWGSAIAAINQAVRDRLEAEYGLIGQLVTPSSSEINYEGDRRDLRPTGQTTFTIQIWRATVGEVRSIGFGEKWRDREDNLDHKRHANIRGQSPIQDGDLLTRPAIDRHVAHLNRHPGRRVDAALAPSGEQGEVVLDYLVTEAKDWALYYQLTNTGSESTDIWVHRIGFFHNQLTQQDDILSVDYITAGFDDSHAILGSYEFRLGKPNRLRAKVYGRYSEYTSGDVGIASSNFEGEGTELGAELSLNVFQRGPFFVDIFGGARWEQIKVQNSTLLIDGDEDFFIPYVGVRAERRSAQWSAFGQVTLDFGSGGGDDIDALGRFDPAKDWVALRGQGSVSFFLEPIFDPRGFRGEKGQRKQTLAHEIYLSVRGQTTFGDRVVPNYQQTAGGFFTVRGYDESEAVGDNALIGTAEYRFHLGRALPMTDQLSTLAGRPFRNRRTEPYGSADWDLILRGFVDAARVTNEDRISLVETDATLVGVGVGAEFRLKRNLTLRLDYGVALTGVGEGLSRRADSGDGHFHFLLTILF